MEVFDFMRKSLLKVAWGAHQAGEDSLPGATAIFGDPNFIQLVTTAVTQHSGFVFENSSNFL